MGGNWHRFFVFEPPRFADNQRPRPGQPIAVELPAVPFKSSMHWQLNSNKMKAGKTSHTKE